MKRIIVFGSEPWTDASRVKNTLLRVIMLDHSKQYTLVHGGGTETAGAIAQDLWRAINPGPVEIHQANTQTQGEDEPPIEQQRDQYIVNLGADFCIAFLKEETNGTHDLATDMAARAEEAGIRVIRVIERENGPDERTDTDGALNWIEPIVEPFPDDGPTPSLEEFRERYEKNDDIFWLLSSGHHQNLLDEAFELLDEAYREIEELRARR